MNVTASSSVLVKGHSQVFIQDKQEGLAWQQAERRGAEDSCQPLVAALPAPPTAQVLGGTGECGRMPRGSGRTGSAGRQPCGTRTDSNFPTYFSFRREVAEPRLAFTYLLHSQFSPRCF